MRKASTGILETCLSFGDVKFRLVDVGGQRSERRKWIHCFQDVSSIIFLVSLAEYNLTLVEDPTMNRLDESLYLYITILSNPWLQSGAMILFLNKKDIFQDKIRLFPLKKTFPDYNGLPGDHIEAREFIADKFTQAGNRFRPEIYSHITCATDAENVKFVFAAVKHRILSKIMEEMFNNSVIID
ncbi:guanine nucleotide-binding protein G(q) subunit alpha isoform X2 [Eurytemora carolleeae]|uniref:guanine nucleotide-binding protein G(q) subunit alpha isoform X2 n=1 Tax=Eurytemora carolleeae TaxID=1294199 RepID=UPI000C77AD2C|nr:guanine nucleotide-binding protein G(q) subunit alpha isoform X2 [Eurytemora carolleeae]|eukprot:XP_023327460.1 guanine nucleotide-binding protein G(q) subunit alpha-like isoform X2 [Eurytemora affinis]